MNKYVKAFSLVIFGTVLLSAQSTSQPSGRAGANTPAPNTTVNPAPQSRLIHILTPVAGQASASNAILLRFQLTNPAASAGSPNFQLQLDGQDPITTTSTEYTFTGLTSGTHSITVVLVDANGTPVGNGSSTVQFTVKNQVAPPSSSSSGIGVSPSDVTNASSTPAELGGTLQPSPSVAGNSMPLVSLIGFGVLIGGVASAFKTRG